jgi:CheY-like chemotaxis protein
VDKAYLRKVVLSRDLHGALLHVDSCIQRSVFQVMVARSGEEILDFVRRENPHVVLSSCDLEGLRGDEVCRVLKRSSEDRRRNVTVLLVGPPDPPEIGERCRGAGCDEFIPTPVSPLLLSRKLSSALGIPFRLQTRIPAVLSISCGRIISEFLGYSKDLSEGGVLVETPLLMPTGRRLNLRLFMEGSDRPLVTRAAVVRSEPSPEEDHYLLGMQFQAMDPDSSARLKGYLHSRAPER